MLTAYLDRIGLDGALAPDLATLRAVVARHTEAIPFENLNPLLGWPVRLDLPSLEQKMIQSGRGGYCFEHNSLLRHALEEIGFRVSGLAARVVLNRDPAEALPARTHMLLLIDLGGEPWIADTGFGGMTPTAPLRLEPGAEQQTPHEPYRLTNDSGVFVLEARVRGEWKPLYRFDLQRQIPTDYDAANWYTSTHPDSKFVRSLVAARAAPGRRYALNGNVLNIHDVSGEPNRRELTSAAELREALETEFRLRLPESTELDEALARVIDGAA